MSRRLINRAGGPVASSSSSASTALPDYEPPSCPLNDAARRALNALSTNRGTVNYQMHIENSVRLIGSSVGDLHERLREQSDTLHRLRSKREERGTDKTPDELRLENHIEDLEAKVYSLTDTSEAAIRDLIDRKVELEDEATIIGDLPTHAAAETAGASNADRETRRSRRSAQERELDSAPPESDEDTEAKAAAPSVLELFNNQRNEKKAEYEDLSMHERYALNNDYAAFKKLWHDSMAGEDGPPLPDASRWFRPDGQPVMRSQADEGGDDDDIAVAREVLSINCPLTLQPMSEPYSNRKCKHTFEKSAILDYLTMRGEKQCPQTGCSQMFSRARFEEDFFLDQAMVRRIRRTLQAQEQQNDEEDEDEDLGDEEVVVRGQNAAPGRVLKKERR